MSRSDAQSRELAAGWRARADRLDAYAARCRREGIIHGPEGAEDAGQAAREYRIAADELDATARVPGEAEQRCQTGAANDEPRMPDDGDRSELGMFRGVALARKLAVSDADRRNHDGY
jgi:hypothetical protein